MKALSNTDVDICKALLMLRGNEPFDKIVLYWRKLEREIVGAVAAQRSESREWHAGRLSVVTEILSAVDEANGR